MLGSVETWLLFGTAVGNAVTAYWAFKAQALNRSNSTNIMRIESNTSSMKDALEKVNLTEEKK